MADSRGLSRPGYWVNHADEILARVEQVSRDTHVSSAALATNVQAVFIPDTDITITKVGFRPDVNATAGTTSFVNLGTAGTAADTIASHATLLLGTAMQTLTLTTVLTASAGEILAFKRTTASAQQTQPAGLVHIEYTMDAIG